MGLNFALLLYEASSSEPTPEDLVRALFPRTRYAASAAGDLAQLGFPDRGDVAVGRHGGTAIVATRDACLFNPTKLNARYLKIADRGEVRLFAQQTAYDMFAYGRWADGELVRSISVNPVGKVWESIGQPEPFESPFWAGERPAPDDYPLPFHPLEMAGACIEAILRVRLEGTGVPGLVWPEDIALRLFTKTL